MLARVGLGNLVFSRRWPSWRSGLLSWRRPWGRSQTNRYSTPQSAGPRWGEAPRPNSNCPSLCSQGPLTAWVQGGSIVVSVFLLAGCRGLWGGPLAAVPPFDVCFVSVGSGQLGPAAGTCERAGLCHARPGGGPVAGITDLQGMWWRVTGLMAVLCTQKCSETRMKKY